MNNNIDTLTNKTVGWVDSIFSFFNNYSNLLVYGVVAMMVAKLMKFKFSFGGHK
jgi:hypothetical protein